MKRINSFVIGSIIMVVTALVYCLATQNVFKFPMCWMCLLCILSLELVTTILCHYAHADPRKVGAALAFLLETIVMIGVSILFINVFVFSYTWYSILVIVLTAITTIISFIILQHTSAVVEKDAALQHSRSFMHQCRSIVQMMLTSEKGSPYTAALKALDEDIQYANDTVNSPIDAQVYASLCELSNNIGVQGYDAPAAIKDISNLMKRRAFEVSE